MFRKSRKIDINEIPSNEEIESLNIGSSQNDISDIDEQVSQDVADNSKPYPHNEETVKNENNHRLSHDNEVHQNKPKKLVLLMTLILLISCGFGCFLYLYEHPSIINVNSINKYIPSFLMPLKQDNVSDQEKPNPMVHIQEQLSQLSLEVKHLEDQLESFKDVPSIANSNTSQIDSLKSSLNNYSGNFNQYRKEISLKFGQMINGHTQQIESFKENQTDISNKQADLKDELRKLQQEDDLLRSKYSQLTKLFNDYKSVSNVTSHKSDTIRSSLSTKTDSKLLNTSNSRDAATTHTLLGLKLSSVEQFGDQVEAYLTDGLAGAIGVMKGDSLGDYIVDEVDTNPEKVLLTNRITNVKIILVKGD